MDEICTLLEARKKKQEEVQKRFFEVGVQKQNLEKLMEDGAKKMALKYKQLRQLRGLQADVRKLAKPVKTDFDGALVKLGEKTSAHEKQLKATEPKRKQPVCEFLQKPLLCVTCTSKPGLSKSILCIHVRILILETECGKR
ncbi:uncharacterized protein PHA67_005817 isoform 1-T1 [Liasis olivaceus]